MICMVVSALAVLACQEVLAPGAERMAANQQQTERAIVPSGDTYISSRYPSANYGSGSVLQLQRVHPNRTTRALLAWSPEAILQAAGNDSVIAARVELTIATNGGGWGAGGRVLSLHAMRAPWTETGATWSCPDANCVLPWNMTNSMPCTEPQADLTPACWEPWTPTDTALIIDDQGGVVSFDVTGDVVHFLRGRFTPFVTSWLLRKVDEAASGAVEFGSRESGSPPRLILTLASGEPPAGVPPVAPNTVPEGFFAEGNFRMGSVCISGRILRGIVVVAFKEGTTQLQKQAAIDLIDGGVVGGVRSRDDIEGWYYVRVEDDPEGRALCDAIDTLNALPQVSYAREELFAETFYRRPEDGG